MFVLLNILVFFSFFLFGCHFVFTPFLKNKYLEFAVFFSHLNFAYKSELFAEKKECLWDLFPPDDIH